VWNQTFKFALTVPDLAVVLFKVSDYDLLSSNDFIAQYAIRANNLAYVSILSLSLSLSLSP
jgi:hypothetical protein